MKEMREDVNVEDLAALTTMVHKMRPDMKDKIVLQIQKNREGDKNIILHLYDRFSKEKKVERQNTESTVVMVSFDLVREFFGINTTDEQGMEI
jgi:hypothetical protein